MKQHPTKNKLSPTEQVLEQRLRATAKPDKAVAWNELAERLGPAHGTPKKRWPLWLAPVGIAAAVAWLMVLQPQATLQPETTPSPMLLAGNYSLDALDRQLQRAYLDGADAAEIEALWQRRAALTGQETSS